MGQESKPSPLATEPPPECGRAERAPQLYAVKRDSASNYLRLTYRDNGPWCCELSDLTVGTAAQVARALVHYGQHNPGFTDEQLDYGMRVIPIRVQHTVLETFEEA